MAGGGANCTGADRDRSERTRANKDDIYHTRLLLVVRRVFNVGVWILALLAQTSLETALQAERACYD